MGVEGVCDGARPCTGAPKSNQSQVDHPTYMGGREGLGGQIAKGGNEKMRGEERRRCGEERMKKARGNEREGEERTQAASNTYATPDPRMFVRGPNQLHRQHVAHFSTERGEHA